MDNDQADMLIGAINQLRDELIELTAAVRKEPSPMATRMENLEEFFKDNLPTIKLGVDKLSDL